MFRPKTSVKEYEPSMLPKNRREVFFDVLKLHWGKLLMMGCLMLLFAFPIHIYALAEDFYQMQLYATLSQIPTEEQAAAITSAILTFNLIRNAVNILLLMVFAVGLAGLARVIRQYAWGENVDFNHDFSLGIKQNAKQFVLVAFIAGMIAFICNYIANISSTIVSSEVYSWLGMIPAVLCAVILIPVAGYALVACSCYENKLRHNLKIGRVCYFRYLWRTLLACVCSLAVFVIQLLPFFWCHLIGRIVASVLIPEIMLGWYLFALGGLDETVNRKLHPELVGKGIYGQEQPSSDIEGSQNNKEITGGTRCE